VSTNAGAALGLPRLGRLAVGGPGDAIVVPVDPVCAGTAAVATIRPVLTVIAGRVAWRS